jgi:hypothetical protein
MGRPSRMKSIFCAFNLSTIRDKRRKLGNNFYLKKSIYTEQMRRRKCIMRRWRKCTIKKKMSVQ